MKQYYRLCMIYHVVCKSPIRVIYGFNTETNICPSSNITINVLIVTSQFNICLIMYYMNLFLMYIVLIVHVISVPL